MAEYFKLIAYMAQPIPKPIGPHCKESPYLTDREEIMTTNLAAQHADSLLTTIQARVYAGSPFGHVNDMEEWHDIDECEADCEQRDASAYDYLEDVLDIQYLVNSDRTYRHARILISFGGPNVWIDTRTHQLEVLWGSDRVERDLPREFVNQLDDALDELYSL